MALLDRLRAAAGALVREAPSEPAIIWPSSGDRGAPGSWQMNLNAPGSQTALLAFSAVYACINVISSDIAKLGWTLLRALADGGEEEATNSPIYPLFTRPNSYQTTVDFVQQFIACALFTGNACALKEFNERGVPIALHVMPPGTCEPLVSELGDVFYKLGRNNFAAESGGVTVPARAVIHHRLMTLRHPLVGISPITAAAMSAATGLTILKNQGVFFENMSRASGVLKAPGRISKELAERLKKDWEENFSAGKFGKTAVLGEGLEWQPLTITAVDSQLIEQLRWTGDDVARVYRVPTFMLGDLSKSTYKNSEQMQRTYYSGCLQYHIEALEARFDAGLEVEPRHGIEFRIENMLRTEIDVRFEAYAKALQSSWLTINEVRAEERRSKIAGGDEPMVQIQYAPLSQIIDGTAAAANAPKGVRAALRAVLASADPSAPTDDATP
jgi:HK97 family phage portal protein